ncbi:MAG TPA: hypothetical protein VHD32_16315 [Candidatus Didemnitutus sp.]|nr:hypothetical protein [Candidatus Didemnitutus sp.]
MTVTTRDFVRQFARLKRSAANGEEIIVRDRSGAAFVFRTRETGPSLADQLSDLRGRMRTGIRQKTLRGFGRNRVPV